MAKKVTILANTLTPGKKGVRIDKAKYELIYNSILSVLKKTEEIPFRDLPRAVNACLRSDFDGSVGWYTTTVKLDMENRGIIERVKGSRPQRLRLIKKEK